MKSILIIIAFYAIQGQAAVATGDVCPQGFRGKVKDVVEEVGPETAFSTNKVIFTNMETTRGEVAEQVLIDVLKNGPFIIEKGKDYQVLMRNGKLCWIERI